LQFQEGAGKFFSGMNMDWLKLDSRLGYDVALDSLDRVEFLMELEGQTGIHIPDQFAEEFESVRDVIEYLRSRQEED
jgi:acyl carrier protein